jgi:hypothetical protein
MIQETKSIVACKGLITYKLINILHDLHDIDKASGDLCMWNLDTVCKEHR